MFLVGRAQARKFLHIEYENVRDIRLWAFCIGARNLLAAAGVFIGLVLLWTGQGLIGTVVVLTASWYMLLASLAMVVADLMGLWRPRGGSIMGTVASSIPPLVVLVAAAL